jgi:hypothetical protein
MVSDTPRQPWDQLPDEPAAAHSRFLVFLHLGPGRNLDLAYQTYRAAAGRDPKRDKKRTPGNWRQDAEQYDWRGRAHAWDVAFFADRLEAVVMAYVRLIEAVIIKTLGALAATAPPANTAELVQILDFLRQRRAAGECRPAGAARPAAGPAGPISDIDEAKWRV